MAIHVQRLDTPHGTLLLGSHDGGLCLIDWLHRRRRQTIDQRLCRGLKTTFVERDDSLLAETRRQLGEYFSGQRREFDLPLAPIGTSFQQTVWQALRRIRYGETASYARLAQDIGRPSAVRAVAAANGANALSIVIPCHRIIGADGKLTGYAGGLDAKAKLLDLEKIQRMSLIREIKHHLNGGCSTFDCELLARSPGEAVIIYRMPADRQLEDLLLPLGTVSVGYFWEDRSYNAYHWVDDAGQTLALYFNICDSTRIDEYSISWRDLVVDVLLTPDRRCRVLDEDELPDDLEIPILARIEATRELLCAAPDALLAEFAARSGKLLGPV